MSSFVNTTIEDFKSQIDIVDVVGRVVPLKRAGSNHKGVCPFHNEKTPSFVVSEQKQIFTCFGCGATGDAIEFTKRYYNIDFKEAVEKLGAEYGIDVKISAGSSDFEKYYEINKEAARFFYKAFTETKNPAYSYMKNREISDSILKKFGIGYADKEWDSLCKFFQKRGTDMSLLVELGLARKKDDHYYDNFRNRVIFPIINTSGKVIGFGGRKIDEKDEPKYLNSPENKIFQKKNNLYALNLTKQDIGKEGFAIMVEGYMDVIGLYQAGVHNVGASLGTALTENQAKHIKKYTKNVVLSYDADNAGRNAALRGIDVLSREGLKVKVLHVTDGKDPDEFVKAKGRDAFNKLVSDAMPSMDYKIEAIKREFDLDTEDGKVDFMKEISRLLKTLSPIEQDVYIKKTAQNYKISEGAIRMEVNNTPIVKQVLRKKTEDEVDISELTAFEATLFKVLFINSGFTERTLTYQDMVQSSLGKRILNICFELYGTRGSFEDRDILDRLDPVEAEKLIAAVGKVIVTGNEETVFSELIRRYELEKLEKKQEEIITRLSIADEEMNDDISTKLTMELMTLQKEISEIGGK